MSQTPLKHLGCFKTDSIPKDIYYDVDKNEILLTHWNYINPSWESTIIISKDLVLKLAKMIEAKEI